MYYRMTRHAIERSRFRVISLHAIDLAILYGKCRSYPDAEIYTIGNREIQEALKNGIDIQSYKNVEVIVGYDDNIITVYRNKKKHSLKKYKKSDRYQSLNQ